MVNMILYDESYNSLADLNEDGSVDIFDVITITTIILDD
jgi:hypothetical protein